MASMSSLYLKKDTLKTMLDALEKKKDNGINLTIAINDEAGQYNNNVSAFVAQSKEDRDAKKDKFYVGNGRTFWTDGTINKIDYIEPNSKPTKQQSDIEDNSNDDELPF